MEWPWVDDPVGYFPDTKSDGQVRAIGVAARDVIRQQKPMGNCPYKQEPDLVDRLRRLAQLEDVPPHVFRHTFGSVAGDLGYSEMTIAAMLSHANAARPKAISISTSRLDLQSRPSPPGSPISRMGSARP